MILTDDSSPIECIRKCTSIREQSLFSWEKREEEKIMFKWAWINEWWLLLRSVPNTNLPTVSQTRTQKTANSHTKRVQSVVHWVPYHWVQSVAVKRPVKWDDIHHFHSIFPCDDDVWHMFVNRSVEKNETLATRPTFTKLEFIQFSGCWMSKQIKKMELMPCNLDTMDFFSGS